jgi:dTDP-4-dehydrorhamnose reductase
MKKLFIIGIGSLTGSKIARLGKNDYEIFGSFNLRDPKIESINSLKFDISKNESLEKILHEISPDVIINCTALNNVDYCENHQAESEKINSNFLKDLSKISNTKNIKLIHLSTDSVFDGTKEMPYVETDIPNPINIYGKTKFIGEKFVLNYTENLVVRASVLYGLLPKKIESLDTSSKKPINFAQWLISKLSKNEEVNIITDELSTPIIADDFANSILHLISKDKIGLFHSAPNIQISRYDFSIKLANYLELDTDLILPTTTQNLGRNVQTALNKCLSSDKLRSTGFNFMTLNESFNLLKQQIKN